MMQPNLQIALDHNSLAEALEDIEQVGKIVDTIEVGTILCLQEGKKAIRCIRELFADKQIVADTKCADAGRTVARNVADAGADVMTVICCASLATMEAAQTQVKQIQIELYGDWTFEQAEKWHKLGIEQAIYHQSRDSLLAGESWGEKDLEKVEQLVELGFKVSVTGGLSPEILPLFKDLPIYSFIVGRGITASKEPLLAAERFKTEIARIWG